MIKAFISEKDWQLDSVYTELMLLLIFLEF
jgi:hypothetical protein